MGNETAVKEMPRYQSHKKVWALKIKSIAIERRMDGKVTFMPEEPGFAPIEISQEYLKKHNPQVGGYYVVYKDGYKSFSPAEAFEEGYSLIEGGQE